MHLPGIHIRYWLVGILECIRRDPNRGKLFQYGQRIQSQEIEQGQLGRVHRFEHLKFFFVFQYELNSRPWTPLVRPDRATKVKKG